MCVSNDLITKRNRWVQRDERFDQIDDALNCYVSILVTSSPDWIFQSLFSVSKICGEPLISNATRTGPFKDLYTFDEEQPMVSPRPFVLGKYFLNIQLSLHHSFSLIFLQTLPGVVHWFFPRRFAPMVPSLYLFTREELRLWEGVQWTFRREFLVCCQSIF